MTKICIVTDTHFGARSDSELFNEFFFEFWEKVFFPYLEKHNIKNVIHMGDLVDRRKFINLNIANSVHSRFFQKLQSMEVTLHVIIGNHDVYYRNTNEVNCMNQIFWGYDNVKIYTEAQDVFLSEENPDRPYAFIPWINSGNQQRTLDYIADTKAEVAFGHLEVAGFEMDVGNVCDSGFSRATFQKFDSVYTGHFHHKSDDGKIFYLGNTYQITWADYGEKRGFHVYDTESRTMDFIVNPYEMFFKLTYDDTNSDFIRRFIQKFSSDSRTKKNPLKNRHVKVIVVNKNDPHLYDDFMDTIQRVGEPFELTTAEDFTLSLEDQEYSESSEEGESLEYGMDTMTVLNRYVDNLSSNNSLPQNIEAVRSKNILRELYVEAVNLENNSSSATTMDDAQ
jgi:DNA repair exonuclease SbcCD nuclease subunit